tara:strand:- start:347 stop:616 length:270 start_codon:yes stop_codon:yes gene_type:complete
MEVTDGTTDPYEGNINAGIEDAIEMWIENQIKQAKEETAIQLYQDESNAKKELLDKITNVKPPSPINKQRGKSMMVTKTTGQQANSSKK